MADAIPIKRKTELVEIPGFASGARVQLRSGGQEMTVREAVKTATDGKFMVRCDWQLGEDGTPASGDYWPEQLFRIERFDV